MDDQLTIEELQIIIDKKILKEYDLTNMYSVLQPASEKRCNECNLVYQDNEINFHSYKSTSCKQCVKMKQKTYYKKNKVKINDYRKRYQAKLNSL